MGDVSDLVVDKCPGDLWAWSVARAYTPAVARDEKCFQFLDNDDEVSLEVIAASVTVNDLTGTK